MTICDFNGDQSLNEDEAGAREKAIDHFGSEERFLAHWTSSELYDQFKCRGIHEEKPDFEPHLSPIFLKSILASLLEERGEDEQYREKIRQFLLEFLDIPGKPTDDELKNHVNDYVKEWQGE